MSVGAPIGTVTLMFTDIEGSTQLWERLGDRFLAILHIHDALIRESFAHYRGYEVKTQGDAFMVAFANATDALQCAVAIQCALMSHAWEEWEGDLKVRIGLHTGEALVRFDSGGRADYFGPMVNRAARIASAGHGGQILISQATFGTIAGRLPPEIQLISLGTHRLKGLEQPEHLYQVVSPLLPERTFPPLRTLDTTRYNLPVPLTSFVGRGIEVRMLSDLVRDPSTRLVTLTGCGGIGKTRLALRVASETADHFPDGVWWVELAEIQHLDAMIQAIVFALNLSPPPQMTLRQYLMDYLADRSLLLVLDSVERVQKAGTFIAEILQSAPHVKCLVTSRVVLRLSGERVFEVRPLGTPPEHLGFHEWSQYEGILLFLERAQTVVPGWQLNEQNASAVLELCRRLEGIPLAIELASARLRILSPTQMLNRWQKRFELLKMKGGSLPERQQALEATLDWSYELLSTEEQHLFAQLSVFAGGFFLEAAEAICEGTDILEGVQDLRDQSLLSTSEVEGYTRYSMLEMVRAYARTRLEIGDAHLCHRVRQQHADYFLRLATELSAQVDTATEVSAFNRIEVELENIRTGMEWASATGQDALYAQYAHALFPFLRRRGCWDERLLCTQRGFECAQCAYGEQHEMVASFAHMLALAYQERGDYEQAHHYYEQSLRLRRALGDRQGTADSLNNLGNLAYSQGNYDEARQLHEESLAIRRSLADLYGIANSLNNLGNLAYIQGEYAEARRLYTESLAIRRTIGDKQGMAISLNNLGIIASEQGNYAEAQRLFEESLSLERELGNKWGVANLLSDLGTLTDKQGDTSSAYQLIKESLVLRRELGDKQGIANSLIALGTVARKQGMYDEARQHLNEALRFCQQLEDRYTMGFALYQLGKVSHAEGNLPQAQHFYREALRLHAELQHKLGIAGTLKELGVLLAHTGHPEEAVKLLRVAERILTELCSPEAEKVTESLGTISSMHSTTPKQCEAWYQQAETLTLEEATALALSILS